MENQARVILSEEEIDAYYDEIIRVNTDRQAFINAKKVKRKKRNSIIRYSFVMLAFVCILSTFLQMSFTVNRRVRSISMLEKELRNASLENDDVQKRLADSMDATVIRNKALALGMSYPKEDMLVYYKVTNEDYMEQFAAVP